MSDKTSQLNDGSPLRQGGKGFYYPSKDHVISHPQYEDYKSIKRRQENIQILTAIGVLGLAGTLYVQNVISFPLVNYIANAPNSMAFARLFIYLNVAFLLIKLSLITVRSEQRQLYSYESTRMRTLTRIIDNLDERISPSLFTSLLLLIPVIVCLLAISEVATSVAPSVTPDQLLLIGYSLIAILTIVPIAYRGYKIISELRSDITGLQYIENEREEASDEYMRLLRQVDKLEKKMEYDHADLRSRFEELFQESRKRTEMDRLQEYTIVYRKLIEKYPIFAKRHLKQGLTSGDCEALSILLRNLYRQERKFEAGETGAESLREEYELLSEVLSSFESQLGIKTEESSNEHDQSDQDSSDR